MRLVKFCSRWLMVACILTLPFLVAQAQTIDDLNLQIKDKQSKLQDLKKQIDTYQNIIATKQSQASSLKNQLDILDDKISQAQLDIKSKQLASDTVTLQIQSVTLDINRHQQTINDKKNKIAEAIRQLYQYNQKTLWEILTLNPSLSQYFNQLNYLEELQRKLQQQTNELQKTKSDLERQQQELALYKADLIKAKTNLEQAQSELQNELEAKQLVLKQTKQSESRYQNLLAQAVQEQQKASAEITSLEKLVRQRLNAKDLQSINNFDTDFIWPVTPYKGISSYFHDPTYIFRQYFEHSGIDIPQPQGTPIKAAAAGYVARAKDAGLGYSYIMLVHNNGLATVYGHVNRIDVMENTFVSKGQIIGASGAMPGTRGAGPFTTGPHLHFEIRLNGIPVDPLQYLP